MLYGCCDEVAGSVFGTQTPLGNGVAIVTMEMRFWEGDVSLVLSDERCMLKVDEK